MMSLRWSSSIRIYLLATTSAIVEPVWLRVPVFSPFCACLIRLLSGPRQILKDGHFLSSRGWQTFAGKMLGDVLEKRKKYVTGRCCSVFVKLFNSRFCYPKCSDSAFPSLSKAIIFITAASLELLLLLYIVIRLWWSAHWRFFHMFWSGWKK